MGITRPGYRAISRHGISNLDSRPSKPGSLRGLKSGQSSAVASRNASLDASLGLGDDPGNPDPHSCLHVRNRVIAEVWGPKGRAKFVKKARIVHNGNIMLTYGLDKLASMLATDAGGASNWCLSGAIGTSTTAAASTQDGLVASTQIVYASQASMVFSRFGAMTWQAAMTFASNGQASQINEVGLSATNAATVSGVARTVLGTNSINRGTADEIRVSYQVVLSTA